MLHNPLVYAGPVLGSGCKVCWSCPAQRCHVLLYIAPVRPVRQGRVACVGAGRESISSPLTTNRNGSSAQITSPQKIGGAFPHPPRALIRHALHRQAVHSDECVCCGSGSTRPMVHETEQQGVPVPRHVGTRPCTTHDAAVIPFGRKGTGRDQQLEITGRVGVRSTNKYGLSQAVPSRPRFQTVKRMTTWHPAARGAASKAQPWPTRTCFNPPHSAHVCHLP